MLWLTPMPDGRPGEFFSWEELTSSATASRLGMDNTPSNEQKVNLKALCNMVLDPLRRHLGKPVRVTSGFRTEALNKALKGSKTSAHRYGLAADIKVTGLDAHALMEAVMLTDIPFDQAIAYDPSRGGHLHIGLSTGRMRRQKLWAKKGGGYVSYESAKSKS
jgi:zinc D-Ala-D-Ala carboxypeptidase